MKAEQYKFLAVMLAQQHGEQKSSKGTNAAAHA